MKKEFDVLCLGLIVVDVLAKPVSRRIFDVDTTKVDKIALVPGGDAMNEAIVFSRMGAAAGLVGKVGNDAFGRFVLEEARNIGVNTSAVAIDDTTVTTTSIVLIGEKGERNFVCCKGNNDSLSIKDIDLSIIKKTRMVTIASLFGLPGLEADGLREILSTAGREGVITAADMTHDVDGKGYDGIKDFLPHIDYYLPSYLEAVHITGQKDPEKAADFLLGKGVKTVVIKLGERGCLIKTAAEKHLLPAYKVPVVDTTGAGDNFTAGFLSGVLKGWDLEKCGRFANATGSICVQELGATTGVKSIEQIISVISDNNK